MGRDGVMQITSGAANGPISLRTSARSSFTSSSSPSVLDSVAVAKAMIASPVSRDAQRSFELFTVSLVSYDGVTILKIHLPLIACGRPTTAAWATEGCLTSADSTSAVPMRWPDTLRTSSTRPVMK